MRWQDVCLIFAALAKLIDFSVHLIEGMPFNGESEHRTLAASHRIIVYFWFYFKCLVLTGCYLTTPYYIRVKAMNEMRPVWVWREPVSKDFLLFGDVLDLLTMTFEIKFKNSEKCRVDARYVHSFVPAAMPRFQKDDPTIRLWIEIFASFDRRTRTRYLRFRSAYSGAILLGVCVCNFNARISITITHTTSLAQH